MRCNPLVGSLAVLRILIVDDDKNVAPLFGRILENAGYAVCSTLSGKEGLRAIQEDAFQLVILDLAMPDVDGFEILMAIRDYVPKPKVLAVSGVFPALLHVAKKCGADLVLDKSRVADSLVASVRSLIEAAS